jgi:hypothetical protein
MMEQGRNNGREKHMNDPCSFFKEYTLEPMRSRNPPNCRRNPAASIKNRKNSSSLISLGLCLLFIPVISYLVLFATPVCDVLAQSSNSSPPTIVPISVQTDRAPSFLEAYWTEDTISTSSSTTNNSKKEIGPGEGTSTLAIVFVNRGRTDITGVTGYLTLPPGFRAIEGENNVTSPNVAVASYDSIIKAGDTFTMYFTVDVLPQAKVGPYTGDLTLSYSKILEVGQISTSLMIPFRLTGKVILDTTLQNQNLTAGYPNPLQIVITNDGTANATGAVVTVEGVSGGTTASNSSTKRSSVNGSSSATVDSESFNIGNIPAGSSVLITPIIYPDYSSEGTIQTLDLEIAYNNAYGIRTDSEYSIGMIVAPNPPESVLSINPGRISATSNSQDNVGNNSKSNTNEAEDEINDNPIKLTAGRVENLRFSITNNGSLPLSDIVFSLTSGTNSVKILGDSRWRVDYMAPQSNFPMSTTVYAAEDVINTPTEFKINAEYIERGQSKTDTLNIGAYVDGQIRVRTYDLDVNYVGGAPNLVGNLLNEGNTVALFTTIELFNPVNDNADTSQSNSTKSWVTGPSQQQYLGDLSENSPLPFSIPLSIDNELPAGNYPVSLNVTYSDNLRNVHDLLLNDTVGYEGQPSASSNDVSNNAAFAFENGFSSILPMVIIIIIVIVVGLFLIRRRLRRKKEGKRTNTKIASASRISDPNKIREDPDKDSDFYLDDELTSKKP